jgi:hypothetical protein
MIGVLLTLALILVALYGVVSFLQRKGEFGRGLDAVMENRNRLAGELSRLSTDAEFLDVYREGETGKTAKELSERMSILTGVFKETIDECDKLKRGKYHRLDRQVHLARVRESFEKIEREIKQLDNKFHDFHETIEKSRKMVMPLQQRFESVKNRIDGILHEKCPLVWKQEWKDLERRLTASSLGESPDSLYDPVAFFSSQIELWMERAEALSVWSEWNQEFKARTKTLESCRERLLAAGAKETHVCKMIEELMEAVKETVSLSPQQVVEKRGIVKAVWLKQQLPTVLSLSMQFLSLLSHPETVSKVVKQCVNDANNLMETLKYSDFVKKENIVLHADKEMNRDSIKDRANWLEILKQTITKVSILSTITVREAIPYIDELLYTSDLLKEYVQKVEQFFMVYTSGQKALSQRVDEIKKSLAEAMAKLAEAGLANAQEFEKLSKWQEDIHQYEETSNPDVVWVEQYEKRIANELVIVDGLVRGHKNLDSSLQTHLDKLSRQGRYSGHRVPVDFPARIPSSGAEDLLGAAFGALIIGEMLSDETWDDHFDIW